jgi:hypothetical protein
MIYAEGTKVIYKQHMGVISFVCDHSICICVSRGEHRSHDVNLVVYRHDFNQIKLFKESEK